MANILILIGAHLCTAPRPQKEADALAQAGHRVTVCGVWFDTASAERDRQLMRHRNWDFRPVLDFRPQRPERWGVRLQHRLAHEQFRRWQRCSPALLGYGARALLKAAIEAQADLTIVHSEAGLWVGDRLLQQGYRVGVDFEDWFSHDLLPQAQATRPIAQLKQLEDRLARACTYCLTTSNALAEALALTYQAPLPTVVYNVFPEAPTSMADASLPPYAHQERGPLPSLHWFSQTIGRGRGLELLWQALPLVQSKVDIHLRGHCSESNRQWLNDSIPEAWRSQVHVHPTVPNAELPHHIAAHDIGLALEQPNPPSRNLTITNKLFQYMQAGLAVIATDTAGQREVFNRCPLIGQLVAAHDPPALAQAIDAWVNQPDHLRDAQTAARQAAQSEFCWDIQRDRLLAAASRALNV